MHFFDFIHHFLKVSYIKLPKYFSILTTYYFLLAFTITTLTIINIKITQTHLRFSPGKPKTPKTQTGVYMRLQTLGY
jgi:hypothetical protein